MRFMNDFDMASEDGSYRVEDGCYESLERAEVRKEIVLSCLM
jgi:hypothetical protein